MKDDDSLIESFLLILEIYSEQFFNIKIIENLFYIKFLMDFLSRMAFLNDKLLVLKISNLIGMKN